MKKIIVLVSVCLCFGFSAAAQEDETKSGDPALVNKRGIDLLPQWGDFAIGVDATPFLDYLGNFLNIRGNQAPNFNGVNQTIYGKYFLSEQRAIRGKLSLNIGSIVNKGVVPNDEEIANNPLNLNATVIDVMKDNLFQMGLSVGYELRRGRGRVQGFYGGEVGLLFGTSNQKFEYANPITAVNQTPSSYWGFNKNYRPVEWKEGNSFGAVVAGFFGVEYFFAPMMSIGGELNLNFIYSVKMQDVLTEEHWNVNANKVDTQSQRSGYLGNEYALRTVPTGSIFLMFHF